MKYTLREVDGKQQFFDELTRAFVELPFTEDATFNPDGGGRLGAMTHCVRLASGDGWIYGALRSVVPESPEQWCYIGEIGFVSDDFSLITPPIFEKVIPGREAGYDDVHCPLLFRKSLAKQDARSSVRSRDASVGAYCAFQGGLFFLPMSWAAATPDYCRAAVDAGRHPPIFLAGVRGQTLGLYYGTSRATLTVESTHETLGTLLSFSSDPLAGAPTASGLLTPGKYYYYCEKHVSLKDLKHWHCSRAFRYTGMAFLGDRHLAVQRDGVWGISTRGESGFAEPAEFCFTMPPQVLAIPGAHRLRYFLVERFGLYGLLWVDSSNIITDGRGYYWALPCEYDEIEYTQALSGHGATDYIPIRKNGRWGLLGIDDFHNIVLPCEYESVSLSRETSLPRLCTTRRMGDEGTYDLTNRRWAVHPHPTEG